MAKIRIVTPEYVKFKSKDGTTVAGYLYKPLDYVAGKKYPTILIPMADRSAPTTATSTTSRNSSPPTAT